MKRFLHLLLAAGLLHLPLLAQDSKTASAIADKQEAEERYKRMTTDVERLLEANLALQRKVSALENELQKVREDQVRSANNNNTIERLKRVEDAIEELVKSRTTDKQKILDAIAKMERNLASPPPSRSQPKVQVTPDVAPGPEKGFPRTIQSGDTLNGLVASYNAAFKAKGLKTITPKQVRDANPNVNWDKPLKIGQKIFIPAPAE